MVSDRYSRHTHVAFSDESKHNTGRYRSLGLVTRSRGMIVATVTWPPIQMPVHDLWTWSRQNGLRYAVRLRQSIPSSGWMTAAGAGRPQR